MVCFNCRVGLKSKKYCGRAAFDTRANQRVWFRTHLCLTDSSVSKAMAIDGWDGDGGDGGTCCMSRLGDSMPGE